MTDPTPKMTWQEALGIARRELDQTASELFACPLHDELLEALAVLRASQLEPRDQTIEECAKALDKWKCVVSMDAAAVVRALKRENEERGK